MLQQLFGRFFLEQFIVRCNNGSSIRSHRGGFVENSTLSRARRSVSHDLGGACRHRLTYTESAALGPSTPPSRCFILRKKKKGTLFCQLLALLWIPTEIKSPNYVNKVSRQTFETAVATLARSGFSEHRTPRCVFLRLFFERQSTR